jgi:signal peptidase II
MTPPRASRAPVIALAAVLAGLDLTVKGIAQRAWETNPVDLGLLHLQVSYNRGVAFSLGAALPGWIIITLTATLSAGLAVHLWRATPTGPRLNSLALAAVLAGATANLVDRSRDGAVTDYLDTGWWPSFNLADTFIVTGGILYALLSLRTTPARKSSSNVAVQTDQTPAEPPLKTDSSKHP